MLANVCNPDILALGLGENGRDPEIAIPT